jgi:hypothetical protein
MPAASQELAIPASGPTEMSMAVPGGGAMAQQFADEGFEGLDFGFGSLPVVSLDQGMFKSSSGDSLGEEFWALLKQSRPKYLFKTALPQNDPRNALCYSYDGIYDVKGEPVQAKLEAWARQGVSYERKQYLEVVAQLANQDTVLLSIPPTSVRRLSGTLANIKNRGMAIENTWVRIHKGPKVTNVTVPFTPWGFEAAQG